MKELDVVKLKDGRIGTIVELFEDACMVDVGDSPKNWDTIFIKKSDIEKVIHK